MNHVWAQLSKKTLCHWKHANVETAAVANTRLVIEISPVAPRVRLHGIKCLHSVKVTRICVGLPSIKRCYSYRGQKSLCSVAVLLEPAEPPTVSAVGQSARSADQSGYEWNDWVHNQQPASAWASARRLRDEEEPVCHHGLLDNKRVHIQ